MGAMGGKNKARRRGRPRGLGLVETDAQFVLFTGAGNDRFRRFGYAQAHLRFGAHNVTAQ